MNAVDFDVEGVRPVVGLDDLLEKLDDAIAVLAATQDFAKPAKIARVLDTARRVMMREGGCAAIEERAMDLEEAGVFLGSDWATPQILVPAFTIHAFQSPSADTVVVESLSELRLLAVARGLYHHPLITAEEARDYLTRVLAVNIGLLFSPPSEGERITQGRLALLSRRVLSHLAEQLGYQYVIEMLIKEIWRILQQRPIQVDGVKSMITRIAVSQADPTINLGNGALGVDRLVSSLFGPTQASREDPGIEIYRMRLQTMDATSLHNEAIGFARAMHDTGLVSPYHPVLIRHLLGGPDNMIPDAFGLSSTGRDCFLCYRDLVYALIDEVVHPETPQAVYGLAMMLERGILYQPPVAPALWRQLGLTLSEWSCRRLNSALGDDVPPRVRLLEGVLCILGLPLGVGQGNNPTCQSARALSMWAYNDPDYLLQMVAWAARDDEVIMHFEGKAVSSRGVVGLEEFALLTDLDPVSLLLVPHLDWIYAEMMHLCEGREGDPHRWVNPEFHGWWSGRGFRINVDVETGNLRDLEDFLRHFYAAYHPFYNGNQPLIHPQPAGIAATDSAGRFVGWHAITILRVGLDPHGVMRVYFYNPNNDSGQDWGDGLTVSVAGHGERFGEASLSFEQFASRLYIFHFDPLEPGVLGSVTREELERVIGYVHRSWGRDRVPADGSDIDAEPGEGAREFR